MGGNGVTAGDLANRLHVDHKRFRDWLRQLVRDGHPLVRGHEQRSSWVFSPVEADQLAREYRGRGRLGVESLAWLTVGEASNHSVDLPVGALVDKDHVPDIQTPRTGNAVELDWMGERVTSLADLLRPGLRAVTVGINPTPRSVAAGHYYQGNNGQAFFKRLALVGLLPDGPGSQDDRAFAAGVGFTDVVKRPTVRADELRPGELAHGRSLLEPKLDALGIPLVVFTFKGAATAVLGPFDGYGLLSPVRVLAGSRVFVMPGPYERADRVRQTLSVLESLVGGS